MAETTDVVTSAGAIGTFVGAVWAALRFGRKQGEDKRETEMDAWQRGVDQVLSDHTAKLTRFESDRIEQRSDMDQLFKEMRKLGESNARIEGALGIQGDHR